MVVELHEWPKLHLAEMCRDFVALLLRNRANCLSLCKSRRIGFASARARPAIAPCQTFFTPAVEAVEPCSRPLVFQQSWCSRFCSHKLKLLSWTAEASPSPSEASRDELGLFEPDAGISLNPLNDISTNSSSSLMPTSLPKPP